jgi:hypothetical protein
MEQEMIEQSKLAPAIHHYLALGLIDDRPRYWKAESNPNERRSRPGCFSVADIGTRAASTVECRWGAQTRRGTKDQCAAPIFLAQGAIIYRAPLAGLP